MANPGEAEPAEHMNNITNNKLRQIKESFSRIFRRKSTRYGIPFLILVVGGSFGLKEFAQLRYQFSKHQSVSPEDVEKYGVKMKKVGEVTLETEYKKIQEMDIDTWSNKRGPRPWESQK